MPEYLSPGVYIEEFEIGAKPIEGVSTSTAGYLGVTLRGPEEPRLITGFEQFKRIYGSFMPIDKSNLAYAVDGFFMNGGKRCFVGRIVAQDAIAMTGDLDTVNIRAIGPGQWGNRIALKIEAGSLQDGTQPEPWDRIKMTVMYWDVLPPSTPPVDPTNPANATNPDRREPVLLEVYDDLSADPTSIDFFETRINKNSKLIRIRPLDPANPANPAQRALDFVAGNGDSFRWPVFRRPLVAGFGRPLTRTTYEQDHVDREDLRQHLEPIRECRECEIERRESVERVWTCTFRPKNPVAG